MCYYHLNIFMGCGHSTFSKTPVKYCKDARRKTQKRSVVPMKSQDENMGPGSGRRCTDSQITLLPEDDSEGRANITVTCSDTSHTLYPKVLTSENRSQDSSSTPTTDVPQLLDTDDRTVSPHSPSPAATQEGVNSPPCLPTMETNTIEPCEDGRVHPLHTIRLERICSACEHKRNQRLRVLYSSMRDIRTDPAKWRRKYQGNVDRKGDGNQRAGMGWSVGVGAAVGGWWDRGKKEGKTEIT